MKIQIWVDNKSDDVPDCICNPTNAWLKGSLVQISGTKSPKTILAILYFYKTNTCVRLDAKNGRTQKDEHPTSSGRPTQQGDRNFKGRFPRMRPIQLKVHN